MFGPASKKQELMLKSEAQVTIIGGAAGSGKSYIMNLIPLKYVDCPKYNGITFRRTTQQLRGGGGMWDTAQNIYSALPKGARPKAIQNDLTMRFPTGAKHKFSHMENAKDFYQHQGLQYTLICFDELTHFTFEQFEYLMSRARSESKYPSRIVASCNPDPDSFVLDLIEWYLDADGYPDPDKDGAIRYFIRRGGEFIWRDTKEEFFDEFGDGPDVLPVSFTFISGTIYDNPPVIKNNPEYLAMLEGLNDVDKARLLYGNWYARPTSSGFFKREWVKSVDKVPDGAKCVRSWDKAATEPSDVNKYPDYTASIKMAKDKSGNYYIVGDYALDNYDDHTKTYGRFRKRPGTRDNLILSQCEVDGPDVEVILALDPGQAGTTEYQEASKKLIEHGFRTRRDPVPNNKSKIARFSPFSAACENGLVYIVERTFDKRTLNAYLSELEAFDGGEGSSKIKKDDWCDATSSGFNYLASQKVLPKFTLPESGVGTLLSKARDAFKIK